MSTDSTELTFVRCPSCRSLVPASQTRCKMCGASLDALGKTAEGDVQPPKSGRVKQRTMSQSKSELSSAAEQLREQAVVTPQPEAEPKERHEAPPQSSAEPEPVAARRGLPADDPLSAYIEEVDAESAGFEELEEAPASAKDLKPAGMNGQPSTKAESKEEAPFADEQPMEEEPKPRVIAESRGRREGGLSFGGGKPQFTARTVEQPVKAAAPERENWKDVGAEPERSARAVPEERPRARDKSQPPPQREQREPGQRSAQTPSRAERIKPAEESSGRLFGWLVTYSSPEGEATELREGKFFVSGRRLKPSDFVIEDASVSTPHAMVTIGLESGFLVQDLMSDRGVFVRRRDADAYQREDTTELKHGDWVRFGDIEYLVSLIAHVGVK